MSLFRKARTQEESPPRKKNIVLHVGHHKTGTSALQTFLTLNKKCLADNDCCYPTSHDEFQKSSSGIPTGGNVGFFADRLRSPEERDIEIPTAENLESAQWLTGQLEDTLILSSENLGGCTTQGFQQLRNIFQLSSFRVVIYLRDQAAFLTSQYQQTVKLGFDPGSLEHFCDKGGFEPDARYPDIINNLEAVFGPENLIVRLYDSNAFVGGSIFSDFCSILDIKDISGWKYPESPINPSLSEIEVAVLIELRKLVPDRRKIWNLSLGMQRVRARLGSEASSYLGSDPFRMNRESFEIACDRFKEENIYLNKKYLHNTPIAIHKPKVFFEGERPSLDENQRLQLLFLASLVESTL